MTTIRKHISLMHACLHSDQQMNASSHAALPCTHARTHTSIFQYVKLRWLRDHRPNQDPKSFLHRHFTQHEEIAK